MFLHPALRLAGWLLAGLGMAWLAQARADMPAASGALPPAHHFVQAQWQLLQAHGFSAPPQHLAPKDLPQAWQDITLPHAPPVSLLRQAATAIHPENSTRTSWFRLSLADLPVAPGPLALYGARVRTDGTVAVYADGRLVHRAQLQGPLWDSARTPLWVPLERSPLGGPPQEILIRLEHSRGSQVALSSLRVGPAEDLRWRYQMRMGFQQDLPEMFSAAFLAVGVFALFVWLRRRRETGYLLFFLLALSAFARGLHIYVARPVADDWFSWLTVNALLWLITVVHLFLRQLHGHALTWLTRSLFGLSIVIGVLTLPMVAGLPNTPKITPLLYALAMLMSAVVGTAGWLCSGRRGAEGRLVALGIAGCTAFGFLDWLLQNNHISPEGWYVSAYTNAVTFCVFGYLMNRRYVGAMAEVEQNNLQLEQRLRVRESELAQSYERLREAAQRQTLSQERQRLTQDMHDGLGSSLVSALRVIEGGRLREVDVAEVLKSCIEDLKLTIDSMEPVEADLLLLLATLRFRLGPRLASAGITLSWEVVDLPALDWLDPRNALHILRILQEAFANILKHTRASEIRVSTAVENNGVLVMISDNGQGFSLENALKKGGKGLHNQRRRASSIGGEVRWAALDPGTRLSLWLPERRQPA